MIVIKPQVVDDIKLTASTAALSDFSIWVSGTTYALGNTRYYKPTGEPYPHDYEALGAITGADALITPDLSPLWLDLGASNRYKMFDAIVGTMTTATADLTVTIEPNSLVGSIALFNLVAAQVQVVVTDIIDGIVYDETMILTDYSLIDSWFDYYFEPVGDRIEDYIFFNIPAYPTAEIAITISNGGASAACGTCVIGQDSNLGVTVFGTNVGLKSYSRKEQDEFGNFIIVKRRFSKTVDYDVAFETNAMGQVQKYFASILDTAVVFIGDKNKTETIVYGFYDDFDVTLSNPAKSDGIIRVVGLI